MICSRLAASSARSFCYSFLWTRSRSASSLARGRLSSSSLVPLSVYDNMLQDLGVTFGTAVKSVNCALIKAAAQRMVNKWRILAGRVEWSNELSVWCIRVPLEGDVSHRLKFTVESNKKVDLDTSTFTELTQRSVEFIPRPPIRLFRHPSVRSSLKSFASTNAPILSIHITEMEDWAYVGLTIPHGLFDGLGLGHLIHNLNAEISGRPWIVPPLSEVNIVSKTASKLAESSPSPCDEPAPLTRFRHLVVPPSIKNDLKFGIRTLRELVWHKVEFRSIFLGKEIVQNLVQKVKDEVRHLGSGWVSTGDILSTWFLKATFSTEDDLKPVYPFTLISMRSTLREREPAFDTYLHNCIMPCVLPTLRKSDLRTKSLADLAIIHRQSIEAMRNESSIHSLNQWASQTAPNSRNLTGLLSHDDTLGFSNQTIGRLDTIDFGFKTHYCWLYLTPVLPDHAVMFREFKGGYVFDAALRRTRWDAVAEEVEKLKVL